MATNKEFKNAGVYKLKVSLVNENYIWLSYEDPIYRKNIYETEIVMNAINVVINVGNSNHKYDSNPYISQLNTDYFGDEP